jgi:DMSO/TMAO reductase YedYZ heme-binding membrane subunit
MRPGLDPRTRLLRWSLFLAIIAMVFLATGTNAIDAVGAWFRDEYQRLPWYVIRVTGWLAYLALAGSVVYGLLLSTKVLDAIAQRTVSFTLHQDLSSIGLALALVHATVLMIDRSVPFTPAHIVIPLAGPYRPVWVAFGQLALALTLVLVASFYLRRRMGQANWRRLHYVSFVAYLAMTVHGLMAGTDSGTAWAVVAYLGSLLLVGALVAYRVASSVVGRHPAKEPGQTRT